MSSNTTIIQPTHTRIILHGIDEFHGPCSVGAIASQKRVGIMMIKPNSFDELLSVAQNEFWTNEEDEENATQIPCCMRVFVHEGYTITNGRSPGSSWGGEVTSNTYDLIRDNDRVEVIRLPIIPSPAPASTPAHKQMNGHGKRKRQDQTDESDEIIADGTRTSPPRHTSRPSPTTTAAAPSPLITTPKSSPQQHTVVDSLAMPPLETADGVVVQPQESVIADSKSMPTTFAPQFQPNTMEQFPMQHPMHPTTPPHTIQFVPPVAPPPFVDPFIPSSQPHGNMLDTYLQYQMMMAFQAQTQDAEFFAQTQVFNSLPPQVQLEWIQAATAASIQPTIQPIVQPLVHPPAPRSAPFTPPHAEGSMPPPLVPVGQMPPNTQSQMSLVPSEPAVVTTLHTQTSQIPSVQIRARDTSNTTSGVNNITTPIATAPTAASNSPIASVANGLSATALVPVPTAASASTIVPVLVPPPSVAPPSGSSPSVASTIAASTAAPTAGTGTVGSSLVQVNFIRFMKDPVTGAMAPDQLVSIRMKHRKPLQKGFNAFCQYKHIDVAQQRFFRPSDDTLSHDRLRTDPSVYDTPLTNNLTPNDLGWQDGEHFIMAKPI